MTDENLDAELRREFDAIFVPYDALRAQAMIDLATQSALSGSRAWARPLSAAAAVLVVAGGGAAVAATHHSVSHAPAGGTSSTETTAPSPTPACTYYSDPTRKPVPRRSVPPCGPADTSQPPTPTCYADPTPSCGSPDSTAPTPTTPSSTTPSSPTPSSKVPSSAPMSTPAVPPISTSPTPMTPTTSGAPRPTS